MTKTFVLTGTAADFDSAMFSRVNTLFVTKLIRSDGPLRQVFAEVAAYGGAILILVVLLFLTKPEGEPIEPGLAVYALILGAVFPQAVRMRMLLRSFARATGRELAGRADQWQAKLSPEGIEVVGAGQSSWLDWSSVTVVEHHRGALGIAGCSQVVAISVAMLGEDADEVRAAVDAWWPGNQPDAAVFR